MAQEEENENNNSPQEHAHNTVEHLKSEAQNKVKGEISKRGKQLAKNVGKKFVKQAGKQAVRQIGTALISTIEVWGPIALIIIGIIFFVLMVTAIITAATSGGDTVNAGTGVDCMSITGNTCVATAANCPASAPADTSGDYTCSATAAPVCCVPLPPAPPAGGGNHTLPTCSNVDSKLKSDLNARVIAGTTWQYDCGMSPYPRNASQTPTCQSKIGFWKIWDHMTYSPSMKNRLISTAYRAELFSNSKNTGHACGYTGWSNQAQLINANIMVTTYYSGSGNYWITHETTHMFQHRDGNLSNRFNVDYLSGDGSACYIGKCMKTYGLPSYCNQSRRNQINESMAEAMALYVYNYHKGPAGTVNNFKRDCPRTYAWVHTYISPNYEFH